MHTYHTIGCIVLLFETKNVKKTNDCNRLKKYGIRNINWFSSVKFTNQNILFTWHNKGKFMLYLQLEYKNVITKCYIKYLVYVLLCMCTLLL